jgi:hypothetical protein
MGDFVDVIGQEDERRTGTVGVKKKRLYEERILPLSLLISRWNLVAPSESGVLPRRFRCSSHESDEYLISDTPTSGCAKSKQKTTLGKMAPLLHHLASALHRRQQPPEDTSNQTSESRNLSGGAIAGIVIGSILGVLLLIWMFRSCGNGFGLGSGPPSSKDHGSHYYHHERDRGHRRGRSRGSSRGYYDDDHHHGSRRHSHHHHHHERRSPRRSGSVRPVVVEKVYAPQAVQQPAAAYYADPRASYGR